MEKGHLRIKTGMDTTGVEAQIEKLERKIDDLKATLADDDRDKFFTKEEILDMQVELEKSEKALNRLKESTVQYQEVNTRTFKKGVNSLKRFGLALFSIRSIYTGLSRASQTYLSQNENTANKLASIWTFAGNAIGPVIEWIANGILKLIGYLNEFLKVFGIDIVAKANAKALEKQAKAQQNLNKQNKQAYDFDVIRTQQDTTTNANGSLSKYGGIDLSSVQLNPDIVNKLQLMAKWLKTNWYWIKEVGKILGVVFGVAAIHKVLKGIGTLLGSAALGTGLMALANVLALIGAGVVIYLAVKGAIEAKKQLDEVKQSYDDLNKSIESVTEKNKEQANSIWEAYESNKIGKEGLQNYKKALDITTEGIKEQILSLQANKTWIGAVIGTNDKMRESQQKFADQLADTVDEYKKLYDAEAISKEEYDKFMRGIANSLDTWDKNGIKTDTLRSKLKNLTKDKYTVTVTASLKDQITSKWTEIMKMIDKNKNNPLVGRYLNIAKSLGFKGFALGGIVTQPTRALIGEAGYPEAVVPMTSDYLSTLAGLIAQYGGNSGNGTVNVYLDGRLIERQISNRQNQRNFVMNR